MLSSRRAQGRTVLNPEPDSVVSHADADCARVGALPIPVVQPIEASQARHAMAVPSQDAGGLAIHDLGERSPQTRKLQHHRMGFDQYISGLAGCQRFNRGEWKCCQTGTVSIGVGYKHITDVLQDEAHAVTICTGALYLHSMDERV